MKRVSWRIGYLRNGRFWVYGKMKMCVFRLCFSEFEEEEEEEEEADLGKGGCWFGFIY